MTPFFLLALFVSAHAQFFPDTSLTQTGNDDSSFILNGDKAPKGAWPWQLSLEAYYEGPDKWGHTCGASLLSTRWALTAAHCVDGRLDYPFRIRTGQSTIVPESDADQTIDVQRIYEHEGYNTPEHPLSNDITLLYLAEDVILSENVKLAKIPAAGQVDEFLEAECWATGFGKDSGRANNIPGYLNQAEVSIIDTKTCQKKMPFGLGEIVTDKQVCIFDWTDTDVKHKKGICQGDSGGPVNCLALDGNYYVMGAASFGVGFPGISTCIPKYPAVYTRASAYRDWIKNISGLDL